MGFLKRLKFKMAGGVIGKLIESVLTKENYQRLMDSILDWFEDQAAKTDNEIDDVLVANLRKALDIPDFGEEEE